jgi:transcriptional regulator with XRE-family HTH domain
LTEIRRNRGKSIDEVAEEIGISAAELAVYEKGNIPSVPVAQRIGKVLQFNWTEFFV